MRSSFLSFAPDVSKEQCRVEHWIDTGNAPGTVKMTPEEIETFQRLLLRITDNMQKYIEEDKS